METGRDRSRLAASAVVFGRCVLAGLTLCLAVPPWGWWPLAFLGVAQWDLGLFRRFVAGRSTIQFRAEMFNVTNRPQFNNPGANRSSLQLNPDGTIRNLNGYTEITGTRSTKSSERSVRLGIRIGF